MRKEAQTLGNSDFAGVIAELSSANTSLQSANATLQAELIHKNLIIKKLQHQLFGRKSEKLGADDVRQCNLFEVAKSEEQGPEVASIKAHTRAVKTRCKAEEEAPEGTFPESLPREDKHLETKPEGVADADLEVVSTKVTERLDALPQQLRVVRLIRTVYKQKSTGKLFAAPAPEHVFGSKCKVTEEFLVLMVIQKYLWHMPLYRQQQQLRLQGVKISRDSMVRWVIQLSELLEPIAQAIARQIREAPWLHIDETPTLVGKGKNKKNKKYDTGYFWPILAPEVGVAFFYRPSRAWRELEVVLNGFSGTLVSDAHGAYEKYVSRTKAHWQLCWMHIRRNFYEARESNPERVEQALGFIGRIYKLEEEFSESKLDKEARGTQRLKRTKPILDEFHQWLKELSATPEALTDELLSKAISYVLKRWDAACLFVYDGALPLDNGADERAIRHSKIGMKNWLHSASEEGAKAVAIFYTLICSALMHGIHPYYYLLDLLGRLDDPSIKADDLTPAIWKEKFYQEAVPSHLQGLLSPGEPAVGGPTAAAA